MKLIFFGGSFDPPHRGHYEIIQYCCNKCDQLVLMPSTLSPLKNQPPIAESHHRSKMLELLTLDIDFPIQIDNWEFTQSGPNYTYQTIQYLEKQYPEYSISMVIGADQLIKFQKWKKYKEILSSVHILGFNRAYCDYTPLSGMNLTWIEDFNVNISSTAIREKIAKGKHIGNELTHSVQDYIQENNLYGYL